MSDQHAPIAGQRAPTHYGSHGQGECGASTGAMTLNPSVVTCSTCRGWLPIVAPELQKKPSAGQPEVDLEAIRRRHPRAFDERWALIPGSGNSDIHQLTAEVESLKQQLAAAQAERAAEAFRSRGIGLDWTPGCFVCGGEDGLRSNISGFVKSKEAGERVVAMFDHGARLDWREFEPLWIQVKIGACTAHVSDLQRLSSATVDANRTISRAMVMEVQRDQLRAEVEAMRGVVGPARELAKDAYYNADGDYALRDGLVIDDLKEALAALDATSAPQSER